MLSGLALRQPSASAAEPFRIDQARALAGDRAAGDAPGFPLTIRRSGTYRLIGTLSVPAGTSGIVIEASDVVLDLNGFTISGPVRCAQDRSSLVVRCSAPTSVRPQVNGVQSSGQRVVIRNGGVGGFAGHGLHLDGSFVVEDLRVHSNTNAGVSATAHGTPGELRDVQVANNAGAGVVCERVQIVRSMVSANGGTGVDCRGAWFSGSETHHNGGRGVAMGAQLGLRSYGNRVRDAFGPAANSGPASVSDRPR